MKDSRNTRGPSGLLSRAVHVNLLAESRSFVAKNAAYYSEQETKTSEDKIARTCLPETCKKLRREILDWAVDPTEDKDDIRFSCIEGMAGTGKSTLARSMAEHVRDAGHIVASFFFNRLEEDRRDVAKVVPTIAIQLAGASTALEGRICQALEGSHDIFNAPYTIQRSGGF